MGRLKINSPNWLRISGFLFGVTVSGDISIYGVGGSICDYVILIYGALVSRFVGCQISITGICSNKLEDMKKRSSGRDESDFAGGGVTVLSWRGRWRRGWTSQR